jgi:hypothetical protein
MLCCLTAWLTSAGPQATSGEPVLGGNLFTASAYTNLNTIGLK